MSDGAATARTSLVVVAVGVPALLALGLGAAHEPGGRVPVAALLTLVALGVVSARMRAQEHRAQIDISFTGVVLLSAGPLVGPWWAGILGGIVPFLARGGGRGLVRAVNAAMTSLIASCAAWGYVAAGGRTVGDGSWHGAGVDEIVRRVALPLVAADLVLIVVNAAVLAGVIRLSGGRARYALSGAFTRTLPLYLGYTVTALVFVLLWGPKGLGPLSAVFVLAPLLTARWAYGQHIAERETQERVLTVLAEAGDAARTPRRALRLEALGNLLAEQLGLGRSESSRLRQAIALHDIGTIAVRPGLLRRDPAGLDDGEFAELARHVEAGARLVAEIDTAGDVVASVRHHHERVDGRGYPDGLAGSGIPRVARMLAVLDTYEALAWPEGTAPDDPGRHEEALAGLDRAVTGGHLDAALVAALTVAVRGDGDGAAGRRLDRLGETGGGAAARPAAARRHTHPDLSARFARAAAAARRRRSAAGAARRPLTFAAAPSRGAAWLVVLAVATGVLLVAPAWRLVPAIPTRVEVVVLVFFVVVVLGERVRARVGGRIESAHTSAAAGIALALSFALPGAGGRPEAIGLTTPLVVGTLALACALDLVRRGRRVADDGGFVAVDAVARLTSALAISLAVRDVRVGGFTLEEALVDRPGWWQALTLSAVGALGLVLEVPIRTAWLARRDRLRHRVAFAELVRSGARIGLALGATGVVIAVLESVLGLVALPLVLLPLGIAQLASRRRERAREATLRCIRALSRMPEVAGVVPVGHADRVARLSVAVARHLGLRESEVQGIRNAALLHDVGQVALQRPIPLGATVLAAPADQARIAARGARLVEGIGDLERVAGIVSDQAVPYHQVVAARRSLDLGSRIVKVTNAFDDHRRSGSLGRPADDADEASLERLYLGLGHEYDPRVVDALATLLSRGDGPAAGPGRAAPAGA